MQSISRRTLLTAAAVLSLPNLARAAKEFADRPMKIIVPFSAGSVTDTVTRFFGNALSERTGQPTIIENKTGAGGIVAMNALRQAPPDGYTVGLVAAGSIVQPWLKKSMPFDVQKDFSPLTMMYAGNYVLVVSPKFPAKTFPEFIEYAKAHPGKVSFGSSGFGTTTQLAAEWLKQLLGLDMVHVPFRGAPEVYTAIFSGSVDAYFDIFGTALPFIKSGRVRALGITSMKRAALLPDVPAIAEFVPDFEVLGWTGFEAPLATPPDVAQRLESVFREILHSAPIQAKFAELGIEPGGNSQKEFAQFIAKEHDKWGRVITAAGIKAE